MFKTNWDISINSTTIKKRLNNFILKDQTNLTTAEEEEDQTDVHPVECALIYAKEIGSKLQNEL